jgi:AAA domain (dynein-related subfamily)
MPSGEGDTSLPNEKPDQLSANSWWNGKGDNDAHTPGTITPLPDGDDSKDHLLPFNEVDPSNGQAFGLLTPPPEAFTGPISTMVDPAARVAHWQEGSEELIAQSLTTEDASERTLQLDDEESEEEPEEEPEWDFVLPKIPPPVVFNPDALDHSAIFSMRELVGAMQRGTDHATVERYLGHFDASVVRGKVNSEVEGFPAMFYAVETNNELIIRAFAGYGGDVNAVYGEKKIPLLAFAVILSETIQRQTTLAVATLFCFGATAEVIPKAFYSPYCVDLQDGGPDMDSLEDLGDENKSWCTSESVRARLARNLDLTQRYYLNRSTQVKKPSIREKQVAKLRKAEALLGIPYFLIGQTPAAAAMRHHLLSYMLRDAGRHTKKPLVLVFAGPSGHGKTELARRLGHLLSLELEVVDCTIYNREDELFGPRAPYVGSAAGSPLNNFLARKSGKKCIVFLDEFEKTTRDIHNALLIPFDKGTCPPCRRLSAC